MAEKPSNPGSNPARHRSRFSSGRFSRRRFLSRSAAYGSGATLGLPVLGAAATLLAACSNDEAAAPILVPMFANDRVLVSGRMQRITFGVAASNPSLDQSQVALPPDDDILDVIILRDGEVAYETTVAGHVVDHDHVGNPDPDHQHANIFRYYPLRAELPEPGIYDLAITIEGHDLQLPIQMFDPDDTSLPLVGDKFPSVVTPTVDDLAGVDRLCTRIEQCPFHATSAATALAAGRPMALLVATPAVCQTAYCGPVLETLIAQSGAFPHIEFIHAEVYANSDEVGGNYLDPDIQVAPALQAIGLEFEPSLFLVGSDGVLVDRLDNLFDSSELADALAAL
ncbi:MAG: hypothetical protein ACRBK7_18110 [Acidimicrobiales bacterium]